MGQDGEIILKLIMEISAYIFWLGSFGFGLRTFYLFVCMYRDEKVRASFLSRVFPVFIFSNNALSERNQPLRKKFLFSLAAFIFSATVFFLIAWMNPEGFGEIS